MRSAPSAFKRAAQRADGSSVVQHIVDFMDGLPPLPLLFLYSAVVSPCLVLMHELGHALVALWRSDGPVLVTLGARRRRFAIRSGRLRIEADELSRCGGICSFDATRLSRVEFAAVALAGPAASLAGAVVTALLWSHTAGAVHDALAVATLGGLFGAIINVLPLTYRESNRAGSPVIRLDGLVAREALRRPARAPVARPAARDVKAGPIAERWAAEVDAASERARAA